MLLTDAPEGIDPNPNNFNTSPNTLTGRAKYLNSTSDKLWERWRREYLVKLREEPSCEWLDRAEGTTTFDDQCRGFIQ